MRVGALLNYILRTKISYGVMTWNLRYQEHINIHVGCTVSSRARRLVGWEFSKTFSGASNCSHAAANTKPM